MAVAERFKAEQAPRNLTWLTVNAHGARGVAPGSVEEVAIPGLIERYIAGHLETARAMLRQGHAGAIELHNLPLGTLAELVAVQARTGGTFVDSPVGVDTFLDPSIGNAGQVTPKAAKRFIQAGGTPGTLRYSIPKIDVVVLNARCVDTKGNAHFHRNSTITESFDGAVAARRNGGIVLVSAQYVSDEMCDGNTNEELILRAEMIDAICLCDAPRMMDPVGITKDFVPRPRSLAAADLVMYNHTWAQMRYINTFIGASPRRSEVDVALGRLASKVFIDSFHDAVPTSDGRLIGTIGIGLPEEVSNNVFDAGLSPGKITLCTEAGTIGGLPCMGLFFGSALRPEKVLSEAGIFHYLKERLHTTCLGALEVDIHGNVNVSRRGPGVLGFVGTGGFMNLVNITRNIVFVFSWSTGNGRGNHPIKIDGASRRVKVNRKGRCKLVASVSEITFSAKEAVRFGKQVWYCTNLGVFRLDHAASELELTHVFAGVDPQRDVVEFSGLPVKVSRTLETLDSSVLTGHGFTLKI